MVVSLRALGTTMGFCLLLSACYTTPGGVDFSPGLKEKLATVSEDSVVLIVGFDGRSTLVTREGRLATECAVPINVARKKGMLGKQMLEQTDDPEHPHDVHHLSYSEGHSGLPKCAGLDKGYIVEAIATKTILIGGPNPHGCDYCVTEADLSGTAREICEPFGCEKLGHRR